MGFPNTSLRPLLAGLIAGLVLAALARSVTPVPVLPLREAPTPAALVDDAEPPAFRGFP